MPFDSTTGIFTSATPDVALPDHPLTVYDFLFDLDRPCSSAPNAFVRPDSRGKTWLVDAETGRSLTFEEARERTLELAKAFDAMGLKEGTTLANVSNNTVDYPICAWAAWRQGAVVLTLNPAFTVSEMAMQLEQVNKHYPVKVVIAAPQAASVVKESCEKSGLASVQVVLMQEGTAVDGVVSTFPSLDTVTAKFSAFPLPSKVVINPDEWLSTVAYIGFSSGTTGPPKRILLPAATIISNAVRGCAHYTHLGAQEMDEIGLACMPFFGAAGLLHAALNWLYHGTCLVISPSFEPSTLFAAIGAHNVSQLVLSPPTAMMLVATETTADLSRVTLVVSAGSPLARKTASALHDMFKNAHIVQAYGQTEAMAISFDINMFSAPFPSCGPLVPNAEVKVVSPSGEALSPGQQGELCVRAPGNALGYLDNEQANRELFDSEGFLRSGDVCWINSNGLVYVVERIKEYIHTSDGSVAPAELEALLLENPEVQDACVIGVVDGQRGQAPKAFIVPATGLKPALAASPAEHLAFVERLKHFVLAHKAPRFALKAVEFVDALPKSPGGKLLRKELRALEARRSAEAQVEAVL
ncbi:hypothetical protein JCM10207_002850 [Rhodosporidiobolus poonsookiae]